MSTTYEYDKAQSESSGTVGRSRTVGHGVAITLDASRRPQPDGITNSEAFLGSVSSCGVTMIETRAAELGLPLQRMRVSIEGRRDPARAYYLSIEMQFEMEGVDDAQGAQLLAYYQANCPLYGTLVRATEVAVRCRCTGRLG